MGLEQNIHDSTVLRILKTEKSHPYKVKLIHESTEDNFDRRLAFCERTEKHQRIGPNFKKNFSDEVTFTLNDHVNRQNRRYWASANPRWAQECHTQRPKALMFGQALYDTEYRAPSSFTAL